MYIVQYENFGPTGFHARELSANVIKLDVCFCRGASGRHRTRLGGGISRLDHSAFALARTKGVQSDIGRNASGPCAETAVTRERVLRERSEHLFETSLDQIVVVVFAPAEDAVESVIDDADETVVNLPRHPHVALDDRLDDLGIRHLRRISRGLLGGAHLCHGSKPGSLGGGA